MENYEDQVRFEDWCDRKCKEFATAKGNVSRAIERCETDSLTISTLSCLVDSKSQLIERALAGCPSPSKNSEDLLKLVLEVQAASHIIYVLNDRQDARLRQGGSS